MANFMATGTGFYVFNLFIKELQTRFNCEEGALSWAFAILIVVGAFYQVVLGRLIPRFGVKSMMLLGSGLAGLSYVLMSRMTSLWQFYILVGVMLAVGNASQSAVTANTVVTRWFLWKRGRALGIATSGISLSGFLLPLVVAQVLRFLSLEATFVTIGLSIWLIIWPLAIALIREFPEDMGLTPDGIETPGDEQDLQRRSMAESDKAEWTARAALRTGAFWKIAISYSFAMMAVSGVMLRVVPHFQNIGFSMETASMFLAGTALLGTIGKVAWGWLCDRFEIRRVISILFFLKALGLVILVLLPTQIGGVLFIFIYGFPMGGVLATLPAVIARCFGSRSFSIVAGTLGPFLIFQAMGHPIMSYIGDLKGSYNPAITIFVAGLVIASILVLSIRFPRMEKPDEK